ncbi:GroES-like protein [Whalleya microplaca]|nr:GroES-like protein [Whalleya microplaca]
MAELPTTMRSLVAPKYCTPKEYEVIDRAVPVIDGPHDVLIRVHASTIGPSETQTTTGQARFIIGQSEIPIKLGIEGSGRVVRVGSAVAAFKPGDAVYVFGVRRPMNLTKAPGFCSEYAIGQESLMIHKPSNCSFEDMTAVANLVTAYQSIEEGLRALRQNGVVDGLEGKTVFVPGALSATGSVGIQLLKNVYGVGKLISTVSTSKVPLVETYLPGLVDQVVDYKTTKLADAIPPGSVDFVYNTQWDLLGTFPLLNRDKGVVVSISSAPPADLLRKILPPLPFFVYWLVTLAQWWYQFHLRGTSIKLRMVSGDPGIREDLEKVGEFLATGKVKPIQRVVDLEDIDTVREAAEQVFTGKGGVGKLVIKIP